MDRINKDGSKFIDRAFSNVYICEFDEGLDVFDVDTEEVLGIAKVSAQKTLDLINCKQQEIPAEIIIKIDEENIVKNKNITIDDLLVNPHETALEKYGYILDKVIELTKN